MATTKIGQVSILPCGAFSLGTHYERLSVVTYNGSSYIAKVENTNKPITDSTVWYLLASKGDKGDTYEVTPEDLQEIADEITSDASSAFNVHVTEKTTEFDNHVTSKTGDFDTNASNKTTTFNNNATDKTTAFNNNASSKTTDFNTNASDKTTAFNTNAQAKVDYYNQNADELIAFNEELLDQIPKKLVEGTTINVNDSSNLPLADIKLKGNASQVTTSIAGGDEYDSPSPDHPQPISVVTGDNTVNVVGKNLLNVDKNLTFTRSKTINLTIPAGTYYITCASAINSDNSNKVTIKFNDNNKVFNLSINQSSTVILSAKETTIYLFAKTDYPTSSGISATIDSLMISLTENTAYDPYTEQSQLISLGNMEFAKIGNYEDKPFKAVAGDETYDSLTAEQKATLTLGKWYKYGAIGKANLSQQSGYSINTSSTSTTRVAWPNGTFPVGSASNMLSNYFKFGAAWSTDEELIGCNAQTNTIYFRANKTTIGTTTEEVATWLSNHEVLAYYIVDNPTITEITDTTLIGQLDNLLAMKTNRNITNMFTVTNNETPTLAVLYRQDLTTLFNNLTSAILSLGNNT